MQLSNKDLNNLAEIAILAAKTAGELIRSYIEIKPDGASRLVNQVDVQHKNAGHTLASQVVTEVDLNSQTIISEALLDTCERFDLAFLSEETPDDRQRLSKDYFWCVDPLDGTLSFIESKPGYAVSIALVSKSGVPIIGIVYDPVEQTLYSAVKGCGVSRNGKAYELPHSTGYYQSTHLTLVCDPSLRLGHPRTFGNSIYREQALNSMASKLGFSGLHLIENNGAVMNACWVLENAPACYFKPVKTTEGGGSLWDFAATAVIFNELNAIVSDASGNPLELNRAESTFMNHRGVIFASHQNIATQIQTLLE